jgi:hypothetical protein
MPSKWQRLSVIVAQSYWGLMLAGAVELEFGRLVEAHDYLTRTFELAHSINASNLEANTLVWLAKVKAAEGKAPEARDLAESAVRVARDVGMTFIGPSVLAVKAALAEDQDEYRETVEEAETILDSGCVAHNHFWFARTLIDHALATGDWDEVERLVARLEFYTREHPLPYSDFLIARGRALVAWGRGTRNTNVMAELRRLYQISVHHGLKPIALELERALVEG